MLDFIPKGVWIAFPAQRSEGEQFPDLTYLVNLLSFWVERVIGCKGSSNSGGGPDSMGTKARTSQAGLDPRSLILAVTMDKSRITFDSSHRCNFYLAFPEPI